MLRGALAPDVSSWSLLCVWQVNSFEQLCINYANEVLQNQFNADVFSQQQREYEAENIPWQHIPFKDNAAMLELLGAKRDGLFTLLDEECRLQTGSPATFVEKITRSNPKSELLIVPKLQRNDMEPSFTIVHYAGRVNYDTSQFLQKNTDPLHPDLLELMAGSSNTRLAALFDSSSPGGKPLGHGGRASLWSMTVGSRFKEQLNELIAAIQRTRVHYIRCVKPNSKSKAIPCSI